MAVGAQNNKGNVDQQISDLAVQWRTLTDLTNQKWAEWNKLGLAGLQGLGYSAADAQQVLNSVNYMHTLAGVYYGTATQASAFNFEDALTPLWGGA